MVAIKAHAVSGFLKSPDPRIAAYLFFGPDAGLVSERARELANRIASTDTPPGEVMRFDDSDLESDPDRLSVELGTIPMFGGRKIVRVTTGRRINTPLLKPLIEHGRLAGVLVVEAGNLKGDDALRQAFDKAPHAAAVPCYGDEAQDLAGLVREMVGAAGKTILPDAQQQLVAHLGADRTLSRGEIEKVILFAGESSSIAVADVEAIVGDATELAIDTIVMATASGNARRAVHEIGRAIEAGESAQGIILAIQRHFQRLHRIRVSLDAGKGFEDVVRLLRPPVYFKHKPLLGAQSRQWTAAALTSAMADISSAARSARLAGALDEAIAERLVWSLAERVAARGRA